MANLEEKSSMLRYKTDAGTYIGQVGLDQKAKILSGRVIGIKDAITFHGATVDEVIQAFHDSVDEYLKFCEELGEKPEKSFSGNIPFRADSEDHYWIYMAAQLEGKSINAWMRDTLVAFAKETVAGSEEKTSTPVPEAPQVTPVELPKVAVVSASRPVKRANTSYGMKRCLVRTRDVSGATITFRGYMLGEIVEKQYTASSAPIKGVTTSPQPLKGRASIKSPFTTRELVKAGE